MAKAVTSDKPELTDWLNMDKPARDEYLGQAGRKDAERPPPKTRIPLPTTFEAPDGRTRFKPNQSRSYQPHIARKICERIMNQEPLSQIVKDPKMPSQQTVIKWLAMAGPAGAEFREMYYYARRVCAELYVDEIFTIADDTTEDWKEVRNKHGDVVDWKPDTECIQRSRVRIDTRKWFAARMMPRIYGDKPEVEADIAGDLMEMLKQASDKTTGLPPIDAEFDYE